jgi:hypothetical protein
MVVHLQIRIVERNQTRLSNVTGNSRLLPKYQGSTHYEFRPIPPNLWSTAALTHLAVDAACDIGIAVGWLF